VIRQVRAVALGLASIMGGWTLFVTILTHTGPITAAEVYVGLWAAASVIGCALNIPAPRRPAPDTLGAGQERTL
jgi:hypothetical protein